MNALRMFDAAARHLNFRLAARELSLTQGAVAQQVRKLEGDLGFQLFHRKPRGLALTDIGRSYHAPIRRALAIIDDATRKLLPQNTRIRVSVTPSFATKWLVPRLTSFTEAHPDIEVQTLATEGLADFQTDGIDIAIRQGRPPFGVGIHNELLARLGLRAVCSPQLARDLAPITRLEDFATLPLIQDGHNLWDSLFDDTGIPGDRRTIRFNQTALAMDAAANGLGIALAPRLLLDSELAQGRLVEVWKDTRANQGGYYIIYPSTRNTTPQTAALLDWFLRQREVTDTAIESGETAI